MDRMSVDLPCDLYFSIASNSTINQIVVTADDSPSAVWNFETEKTEQIESSLVQTLITIGSTILAGVVSSLVIHFLKRLIPIIQK